VAFTIPDNDEVSSPYHQARWMQTDIDALVSGIAGNGILSGCAVTAQGSPNMTVAVAAGLVLIAGALVVVASGNVTIGAADATNPRFDLVVVNNAGTKSVTAGTPAANPKAPDIPADSVLLATVYVPANDTTIESAQIIQKQVGVRPDNPLFTVTFVLAGFGSGINSNTLLAAETELNQRARSTVDLSRCTHARVVVYNNTAYAVAASIYPKYHPTPTGVSTAASFVHMDGGASAASSAVLNVVGLQYSDWIPLESAARANVAVSMFTINGNGSASHSFGRAEIQFK
jgi:hypothetical protein